MGDKVVERKLLGVPELAEYLDVSVNTLRSWVWQRRIPYSKVGRLVKFDRLKIEAWLKDKEVQELT